VKRPFARALLVLVAVVLAVVSMTLVSPSAALEIDPRMELHGPPGWIATSGIQNGRYEQYWVAVLNGSIDAEAVSPTPRYRTYSPWKEVPRDRVLVRVATSFSPATLTTARPDSAFPLDWSRAERVRDDWDFEVWQLPFSLRGTAFVAVVHVGRAASALDRAAVRAIIASVRPRT
jgi:hypothetical protein